MKPLTIKDLYQECKEQIQNGNGNKVIMISQDDEGNSFHYLWYSFTDLRNAYISKEEINEDIAKYEDTIILG